MANKFSVGKADIKKAVEDRPWSEVLQMQTLRAADWEEQEGHGDQVHEDR